MASSGTKLTPLQQEVLVAFFQREKEYFLTRGAALAGFHLRHRHTDDLDLFTISDVAFECGRRVLEDVAIALGGTLEVRVQAPRFLRTVITRGDEALVIDLVRDLNYQMRTKKQIEGDITLDPADEILANKLTTIVARAEERDLVDLYFLEKSGLRIEDALPVALQKDGGCTPATLAWLLSEVTIPDNLPLPEGLTGTQLREFVADLIHRLQRAALPTTP
jgi:Nucleotidyl transferase AbiEii toxin, Type IV TA system